MCEARKQRGLMIAAMCRVSKDGDIWNVPSQSGNGAYVVASHPKYISCTCPDFETTQDRCKHIYAVEFAKQREEKGESRKHQAMDALSNTESHRPTYPQRWSLYNAAQTSEKDRFQSLLRNLCDMIDEPNAPPTAGRPRIPLSDQIFMSVFKVYSTVSQRRFMCDLDEATERGYLERTPHFNAIGKSLESEELTPKLHDLIIKSSLPLKTVESDFAVDSTGFSSSKFIRWFDHKYGKVRMAHTWVKLHAICGVKTNVITSCRILEPTANDCPVLPSLVQETLQNFKVREVSADAAYGSLENFDMLAENNIDPFIAFKSNTTGGIGGAFAKAFHFFSLYKDEFFQSYHKRSNVESTFSMIKRKFGDSVRSKNQVAMNNEVLCKILAHNICCLISAIHELGIEPTLGHTHGIA